MGITTPRLVGVDQRSVSHKLVFIQKLLAGICCSSVVNVVVYF